MTKYPRYQDYVIKDGRLVGEFDDLYRDYSDPWHQSREPFAADKGACLALMRRLRHVFGCERVVEVGCGLGHYAAGIAALGFETVGIDVSRTAIARAERMFPQVRFRHSGIDNHRLLAELRPDIIVLAETSWYVLDHLRDFIGFMRAELPETFLVHSLHTYPADEQTYGREYFTDGQSIRAFFGMTYLEWGNCVSTDGGSRNYFVGTWLPERVGAWDANEPVGRSAAP